MLVGFFQSLDSLYTRDGVCRSGVMLYWSCRSPGGWALGLSTRPVSFSLAVSATRVVWIGGAKFC